MVMDNLPGHGGKPTAGQDWEEIDKEDWNINTVHNTVRQKNMLFRNKTVAPKKTIKKIKKKLLFKNNVARILYNSLCRNGKILCIEIAMQLFQKRHCTKIFF